MRKNKAQAITLRKSGISYSEIRKTLGIPVSTLSDWFRDQEWSKNIKYQLNAKNLRGSTIRIVNLNKTRGENLNKLYTAAREEARSELQILKNHPLFVAGVMIYWGEGDKRSKHGFRVSNSDPLLIKTYLAFLRKICGAQEGRIRAGLLIYPDLNKETCEKHWAEQIGLPRSNFTKSIVIQGRSKTARVPYGICTLSFSSRFLKEKMLIWMSELPKELIK